ncbi:MAG: TPM domain-containing protein [Treponemataceae bacterium]|nr:TPM domain-containing protein [Treponemataceae bacterium]
MKRKILVLCISLFSFMAFCLEVPPLKAHINDYAGIMNALDERKAEQYLSDLETTTGIQIALLTIPSLEGENLELFANTVAEKWGLGQKKEDNGALLLVAFSDRKIRIEVGYGLEDKLTDAKTGLIIRNVIVPEFQMGNYSSGIFRALQNMGGIASDDASLISKSVASGKEQKEELTSVLFAVLFFIGWFILFSCLASGRQNHWLPWIIFFPHSTRRNHFGTTYHSHSSGSGFSSGFKGGGGHFGGGGASGGW